MKKGLLIAAAMVVGFFAATEAKAEGYLQWVSKTCVIVDGTFNVCKPSKSWDTQKKDIHDEAVRWVLHRSGANPVIRLIYDPSATGNTAHEYGKRVKKDLELRGINVTKLENRVINGRNVSLISGRGGSDKLDYLVAVYRDQNKGLKLEFTAAPEDFGFFSNEFMTGTVNTVRFVR